LYFSKNSLKDSKKHNSRRSNKNNQQISIITSDSTAINAHPTQIQMQQQQQPHYDNRMNTQVKTYTDHGNGHSVMRTGNSSHYSKVRYFVCINKKIRSDGEISKQTLPSTFQISLYNSLKYL
jgi:palmitoyltransferase